MYQQHNDVISKKGPASCHNIKQQTAKGDGAGAHHATQHRETEVSEDDEQCGHAHHKLDEQRIGISEMGADGVQGRCDGGSRHHGQQRHRKDGRNKNLWIG